MENFEFDLDMVLPLLSSGNKNHVGLLRQIDQCLKNGDNFQVIKEILNRHTDKSLENDCCLWTPFYTAVVIRADLQIAKLLLEHGASVNETECSFFKTSLHSATEMNNLDAINFLIENGADVNRVDHFEKKPLVYAIENNNEEIINLLENYGAYI